MTGHPFVPENLARGLHREQTYEEYRDGSIRESALVVVCPPVFRTLNSKQSERFPMIRPAE